MSIECSVEGIDTKGLLLIHSPNKRLCRIQLCSDGEDLVSKVYAKTYMWRQEERFRR